MEMQQMIRRLLAGQEQIMADRGADPEQMDANIKDLKENIKSSKAEMTSIVDAWITGTNNARKKTNACQEVTGVNPEKMEPNPEEKEAVVKWQEILNEEAAVHSLRACRERRWPAKKRQSHVWNARSQSQRTLRPAKRRSPATKRLKQTQKRLSPI
jgi:hypothetical protein